MKLKNILQVLIYFCLLPFSFQLNAQDEVLVATVEAESGELSGVTISSTIAGYSGDGYVTGLDNSGDKFTITVNIPEKDFYRIIIRYNGKNGNKEQKISVNNQSTSSIQFPKTETWTNLDAGKFLMNEGENTIAIIKDWGWTDFDKFDFFEAQPNQFTVSENLVDKEATPETKELYEFLKLQFGDRIISGQTHGNYNRIKEITDKSPMLRVGDFQHFTEGYPYLWENGGHTFGKHDDSSVDELKTWYNQTNKKGIISYQWHWHSPTGGEVGTNTFYTNKTTFDIRQAVISGTSENNDILRDIDDIATELKKFQDANIPILFRPLHEAGGGWFWWGAKGAEPCLMLYDILYDRLKNHHQLHNLIWVWSTPESSWYPGNDKVDIIGHDSYPGDYNYNSQKPAFDKLFNLTNGEKLIAMTENGPIPDPDECFEQDATWLFFMSWSNLVEEQNENSHIQEVYNHPAVITIESDNIIEDNLYVKFELKEGTVPVNNATVILNNDTLITTELGIASFKNLENQKNYNYLIFKSGYNDVSGALYLTADTTINIQMLAYPTPAIIYTGNNKLKVWPNPVIDAIQFQVPNNLINGKGEILNLQGSILKSFQLENKNEHQIKLNDLPAGMYLLKLYFNQNKFNTLFIKSN